VGAFVLDEEFASQLVDAMQQANGHFILGNVGGLIGNAPVPITEHALTILLQHRDEMPGGGKLVFFSGLGHRILREFENDHSWEMLRNRAAEIFEPQLDPHRCRHTAVTSAGNERIIASLSWCYLSIFANQAWPRPVNPPATAWPGLCETDTERRQIVDRLHAAFADGSTTRLHTPTDVYRNCQFAFAYVQSEVLTHPKSRPISIVHYLYTLAATAEAGVLIPEAHALLNAVVKPGSPHEAVYEKYEVAQLNTIFSASRSLLAGRL
jgi:hypothetical protein